MKARAFGLSDVGRCRESNEDNYLCEPSLGLYAVADGMGGHAAGEIASQLAVDALIETIAGNGAGRHEFEATERLREAVTEANRRICESIETHDEQRGMGTTVVVMLAQNDQAFIGHVGDSRAYLFRDGELSRLTVDHSWVSEQVRAGLLTDDAAKHHPMRNIVTRALGSRAQVLVDLQENQMRPGDLYLLCSDGLNAMLGDDEIRDTLNSRADDPEGACRALVDAANARGGEDNTTVVIVRV
jgi:protein phosphatase